MPVARLMPSESDPIELGDLDMFRFSDTHVYQR